MRKTYRPYCPEQQFLLPPSLQDWLPENHLTYFVSEMVSSFDLSAIESVYERESRGQPPFHPEMMTKILVYGYCVGVFSSRKIERQLVENVALRVLAAGNTPDFRTIALFRKQHRQALEGLFEQVLDMAVEAGVLKLGRVVLDGSKIKANASKHKAMSYGRMRERTRELRRQVRELLNQAEAIDEQEDRLYGKEARGDELPEQLQRRETRLKRIAEAKGRLQERARQQAKAAGKDEKTAKPEDKDQYNFTDPESRIMKGTDGFIQAYNAQLAVDEKTQLIVAQRVSNQENDKEQLAPMVEAVTASMGRAPDGVVTDNGYCSEKNLDYLEEKKIDGYIATGKVKHGMVSAPCPRGRLPKGSTTVDRMRRKLVTKRGRRIYARRKTTVEPTIGQIKHRQGFRQFLLRGLEKAGSEWALVCLGHNILKLHRLCTT